MKIFNDIQKDNFTFRDVPKKRNNLDYDKAKKDFIRYVSKSKDVSAIYQIGEVSRLGMSDLDFIVVLKNKIVDTKNTITYIEKSMKTHPYLIMHHPLMISEKNFSELNYLFPVFSIKKLHGNSIKIKKIKNKKIISTIILTDYINFHWPREFTRYFLEKKIKTNNKYSYIFKEISKLFGINLGKLEIPIRNVLSRLNSMKYPLHLLKEITNKKYPEWEKHMLSIDKLRRDWFKLGPKKYDTLIKIMKKNIIFNYFLIEELKKEYKKNKFINSNLKIAIFIEKEHSCIFLKKWDSKDSFEKTNRIYKKTKEINSVLPIEFFYQRIYLDYLIKHKSLKNFKIKKEYLKVLNKRFKLYREEIDFLNKNKFYFKPIMKFDYLITKSFAHKLFLVISKSIRRAKLKNAIKKGIIQ